MTVTTWVRDRLPVSGDWLQRLRERLNELTAMDRGNVAMIVALTVLPVAFITGFAIDFQMLTSKKNKAQYNLDSAVIAGTRALREGGSHATVKLLVQDYFASALQSTETFITCETPVVMIDETDVEASTSCAMGTTLSAVGGIEELSFSINTATTYGIGKVDVAFVFDVSGSMGGSRLADLKIAAYDAVDTLLPDNPPPGQEDDIRISMVAYNGSFNAGSYFEAVTGVEPDENPAYRWYEHNNRWYRYHSHDYYTTCVFERTGSEAYTDDLPSSGDYLTPASESDRNECSDARPLELTSDEAPLDDYIEDLSAGGNTAGHLGIAWGWYTISPEWASLLPTGSKPLGYDEPDTAKALVLMTDGAFNREYHGYYNGDSDDQARDLCENIRETGIIIYSVAFQAPEAGEDVLRDCASGAENFFDPQNGDELNDAYRSIATSISDLRITR